MCQIICNVTYRCGHTEPRVESRDCQFIDRGHRKRTAKDPLCLLYRHCSEFGRVRQISITDSLLCSTCFISKLTGQENLSSRARKNKIDATRKNAARHSNHAEKCIAESEKRARLEDLPIAYINKVSEVALRRLDIAFSDAQMNTCHFEDLLQIVIGLPFLDKGRLVEKFAGKIEQKLGTGEMKHFYELSMKYRNFGDEFRKGLKNPSVLDEV
ncbi:hypothetical protein F4825DRAFT_449672 [Nemania diffusa]|nr:hypothetical protein F4825DRAFT_449672 [Nemania diffusa]